MSDRRVLLAAELRAALDDPARYQWGEGPWEHLGDAERDVRELLAALDSLTAENERLREALRAVAWNDTTGPCWCPGENERDETGEPHLDHCIKAREALKERPGG